MYHVNCCQILDMLIHYIMLSKGYFVATMFLLFPSHKEWKSFRLPNSINYFILFSWKEKYTTGYFYKKNHTNKSWTDVQRKYVVNNVDTLKSSMTKRPVHKPTLKNSKKHAEQQDVTMFMYTFKWLKCYINEHL